MKESFFESVMRRNKADGLAFVMHEAWRALDLFGLYADIKEDSALNDGVLKTAKMYYDIANETDKQGNNIGFDYNGLLKALKHYQQKATEGSELYKYISEITDRIEKGTSALEKLAKRAA